MSFTSDQKHYLAQPLDPKNVASRSQSGRDLSYIEGWHAIAEANRIFGFDGWTRETVDLRQLGEPYQTTGKDTWRVNYSAKVRIVAGGVVREGCGFGQGIDRDVGQAHESALKEAETDAMKRALMTFGNPFGLALYDKTQANVRTPARDEPDPATPINDEQRNWLAIKIDAAGVPVGDVCQHFGVQSLKELNFGQIKEAVDWLKTQRKAA